MDTQKLELIPKTKSTKLRNEVITSLSFFDYYIQSKLIVHKFNFLIEYYLSEIFGNGCKRRTRSCNWIQWGPVTINKWLIIVRRHETPSIGQRYCVNQLFDLEHPATENIEVSPRANCISFVLFFWHRDSFYYRTRTGARALMYQTIRYHPEPSSDTVPKKKKKEWNRYNKLRRQKKSRRKKRENYSGMYNADPIQETNIDIVSYP